MARSSSFIFGGALLLTLVCAGRAQADENNAAAANAYSRAQKALMSGDYDQAAELFELADSLVPSPQALRSAASARKAAGELATAAARAEELRARYQDAESQKLANEILDDAKKNLARYEVSCSPDPCQLLEDGNVITASAKDHHFVFLKPGPHELGAVFGTRRAKPESVKAVAGASASIKFEAPAAPEPAATKPPPETLSPETGTEAPKDTGTQASRGLSPWIFGTAAAVTVVAGGLAIWSGVDTLSARDQYDKHRTQAGYEDGQSKERRTNTLFAVTGVAAAATITLAFFTDWGGHDKTESSRGFKLPVVSAGIGRNSGAVVLQGNF